MYLAMNRFTVPVENADAFEAVWLGRDSHLKDMAGFVGFHMLRGPETDGKILYASHTTWESEEAFSAWTKSEQFRAAHRDAGQTTKLFVGHPNFEGFTSIQNIAAKESAA
ncbi:MAG: antibiotic biosynthesis monooxygenase [Pseudomonadota bacterium]